MPFRFSLDSVLRLRRSEHRQQELILQRVNEHANRVQRELDNCEQELLHCTRELSSSEKITGAEMQFEQQHHRLLEVRRMEITEQLQRAREQQAFASQEFRHAWQKRESLESLAKRDREFFLQNEVREAQRRQDDLFLQRKRNR